MDELPTWLDWEIVITRHCARRMLERGLLEVDLRGALEQPDRVVTLEGEGRFLISARIDGAGWTICVEPDVSEQVLVIVTVFRPE